MNFNDNGTISFPIGGKTYSLKAPTIGQVAEFTELHSTLRADALNQLTEWTKRLADDEISDEEKAELRARDTSTTFVLDHINEPWLRKAFETFGSDTLPDDLTEAPAELLSNSIVASIIQHWRSDPLARSRLRERRGPAN